MADQRTTAYVVAGVLAVGGVGLVIMALNQQAGPPTPGQWSDPYVPGFPTNPQIPLGGTFHVLNPKIKYAGPGIDTFTYLQAKQVYQGQEVSVMGSGVAGVHVGPATSLTEFPLVSATQPQPAGEPAGSLMMGPWPGLRNAAGNIPTPICGKPPVPGPGYIYLQVYQKDAGDGFSAPTCNKRTLIRQVRWACTFV